MSRRRLGASKLKAYLVELGAEVSDEAKRALAEGADEVVDEAKRLCSVNVDGKNSNAPGALRDSIKATPNQDGTRIKITAGATNPKTGMPYGQFVEFDPKIKEPFMYPAIDAKRDKVRQGVIDAIRKAVRNSAKS